MTDGIVIAPEQLSPEALQGIIEEFVTREGTEYGFQDVPLAEKVAQVKRQLHRGEVQILFDPKTETVNLHRPRA